MLFEGVLPKGKELPLVEALIESGADLDFKRDGEDDTPLIRAASLGTEDVGLRMLDAGANPNLRGRGGETALQWAALLGEDRLAERLVKVVADIDLKDDEYHSSPLGWAIHGWCNPPAGNQGRQRKVAALLVAAGATSRNGWSLTTCEMLIPSCWLRFGVRRAKTCSHSSFVDKRKTTILNGRNYALYKVAYHQ